LFPAGALRAGSFFPRCLSLVVFSDLDRGTQSLADFLCSYLRSSARLFCFFFFRNHRPFSPFVCVCLPADRTGSAKLVQRDPFTSVFSSPPVSVLFSLFLDLRFFPLAWAFGVSLSSFVNPSRPRRASFVAFPRVFVFPPSPWRTQSRRGQIHLSPLSSLPVWHLFLLHVSFDQQQKVCFILTVFPLLLTYLTDLAPYRRGPSFSFVCLRPC